MFITVQNIKQNLTEKCKYFADIDQNSLSYFQNSSLINTTMSRFFEAYLPQIQNLLHTHTKPKSTKKYSSSSEPPKISHNKPVHNFPTKIQKQQYTEAKNIQTTVNNYNIFSTNFTDLADYFNSQNDIESEKSHLRPRKFIYFSQNDLDNGLNSVQMPSKQEKNTHSKIMSPLKNFEDPIQQNTFPFSKKRQKLNSKSKLSHEQLRETLIKSASNEKQSQRLEMIFESARKFTKPQNQVFTQVSNKKQNSILNPIKVNEVSRAILRKSFCLQMIEDDNEWDRVITNPNSKKKWTDEQIDEN